MRKMRHVDSRTAFLGQSVSLGSEIVSARLQQRLMYISVQQPVPIFIAPAGLARLGHPDGELNIARGAAEHDIVQVVSSGASASIDEIFAAKAPSQTMFWQFYVPSDRGLAEKKLKHAVELGAKAIFVTCDVPVLGKRERDLKLKARSQNYEHPIAAVRLIPTLKSSRAALTPRLRCSNGKRPGLQTGTPSRTEASPTSLTVRALFFSFLMRLPI